MKTFQLIIAGGRTFDNPVLLYEKVDSYRKIHGLYHVEIVSGGAQGVDKIGEEYAMDHDLPLKVFPADWDKYGKQAGYRRNKQMAEYATNCICFWDGKSKGTKLMIDLAKEYKLYLKVIRY